MKQFVLLRGGELGLGFPVQFFNESDAEIASLDGYSVQIRVTRPDGWLCFIGADDCDEGPWIFVKQEFIEKHFEVLGEL